MDMFQNRRFLSCKMSYHIRRTTCERLARRFPLHNKFINPHLLCLGFLFQLSFLKHQSERYHEKDARTPYRPDSELRHGKRTKSSTECEQRDDAKVTFRSEPRPPTAAGQGEKRRYAPCVRGVRPLHPHQPQVSGSGRWRGAGSSTWPLRLYRGSGSRFRFRAAHPQNSRQGS